MEQNLDHSSIATITHRGLGARRAMTLLTKDRKAAIEGLTDNQRRVLALIGSEGLTMRALANRLGRSKGAIKDTTRSLRRALILPNWTALVAFAAQWQADETSRRSAA